MIETIEDLLKAYHSARLYVIGDTSGSFGPDARELDEEIEALAHRLNVKWDGCDCAEVYYDYYPEEEEPMRATIVKKFVEVGALGMLEAGTEVDVVPGVGDKYVVTLDGTSTTVDGTWFASVAVFRSAEALGYRRTP